MALSKERINELATGKNVRTIAVQNFLGTVDANENEQYALGNLSMDAGLYKWNAATVGAIRKGIREYFAR